MSRNVVKDKSFAFAIRIVKLYQYLTDTRKEYGLSRLLLRSGTSVGAMVREAEHAETKADFKHKMAIAQKEINETIYWLELLDKTGFLTVQEFTSMNADAVEIIKLLTSILKSIKSNNDNR